MGKEWWVTRYTCQSGMGHNYLTKSKVGIGNPRARATRTGTSGKASCEWSCLQSKHVEYSHVEQSSHMRTIVGTPLHRFRHGSTKKVRKYLTKFKERGAHETVWLDEDFFQDYPDLLTTYQEFMQIGGCHMHTLLYVPCGHTTPPRAQIT